MVLGNSFEKVYHQRLDLLSPLYSIENHVVVFDYSVIDSFARMN